MGIFKDLIRKSKDHIDKQNRIKQGLKDGILVRYGSHDWMEREFANSGLDPSYHDAWMSNPYWETFNTYNDSSGFGADLESLIFGTSANQRNAAQAKQDALNYWSNLINESRQNAYNSPLNQVALMNQAGLNPNLQGIGDVANDSGLSPVSDPTNMEDNSSALSTIPSIVNPFIGIANTFVSLVQGFQQLKGLRLDNELKNVAKYQSIGDLADSAAASSITPATFQAIEKLSESEKAALIAGDSDFDDVLDASTKTSSSADAWIKSFPAARNKREQAFLDKARSEFILRRNGILRQADSWDAFVRMRKSIADPANSDFEQYANYQKAALEFENARLERDSILVQLESALYTDNVFQSLWKSEKLASLRAEVSASVLANSQNQFNQAVIDEYSNDPDVVNDASEAVKEAFRAKVQEMIARKLDAKLNQTTINIRQKYFDTYATDGGFLHDLHYRFFSPELKVYKEASGHPTSTTESVGRGTAVSADFLIKLLAL